MHDSPNDDGIGGKSLGKYPFGSDRSAKCKWISHGVICDKVVQGRYHWRYICDICIVYLVGHQRQGKHVYKYKRRYKAS